jgi:uncharacterized protein YjbI with pentapeptide repeats
MSEYTREEILKLIEENGGPEGLDLSGKDLSGIDLSREAIEAELEKVRERVLDEAPVWYSTLTEGINLEGANLQEADLRGADLQEANLYDANLQQAKLMGANLQGANLQRADLQGADLEEAKLWLANLQGAFLQGADLRRASLVGLDLEGAGPFGARSLEGAYFFRASLDSTSLEREQLGEAIGEDLEKDYGRAKEGYLALKSNFAHIGRYDDAVWAYCKERQMEKATKAPWRARGKGHYGGLLPLPAKVRKFWEELRGLGLQPPAAYFSLPCWSPLVWWFWFKYTLKWLADWFVELLCGYGESIWRVLVWMLLVVLGFAAYYQVSHAVVTSSQDAATSLWDHLIFSLGAFTTLQPARLQAARPGVELLTTVQAIIGISLAGLLGFVTGNRIRRS